ncbi:Dolichyl-phosphate-mannose--protein mannosyltransferase, family GT39 [Chondrus crispus]|uniref:Dolichyl-phosphate-mannose--protein mannosyltransferase, family GT39 n=1 Tax=Chondrus crispus TaxID=2769 RepID=R7QDQ8_CHOCR|nr:Dolichyl-phosphate-mannose--protein mannosyltransferase, family GT39 [Chondrus crispus]CDF36224.1 Dolichyl-phosphate-mannose--protein mannosyltransferase, family GT39 [Chondrus crispus]|eukprot:XP_005716043.1 Dolichyl-phosphate-mannose--protein mannosyltransferase, family GT39 [Chondrus crispus]
MPALQPAHEGLIAALLQGRLGVRRVLRQWSRDWKRRDARAVFLDGGEGHASDDALGTSSKHRRRNPACLPARPRDAPPTSNALVAAVLFAVALCVRGWGISFPPSVVFDEVHFLRFVKAYYYGRYFFDIHPPLGKLVLLLVTKLFCNPPRLDYKVNGEQFGEQIYTPLRWTSALFGSTIAPVTYLICRELGLSFPASLVPGVAFAFEHLTVIESRLVLLDAQLMSFMALCLLFALKLWGARKGTARRRRFLVLTALSGAAAIGVKWTALATPGLVALVSLAGRPFPREGRLQWGEMGLAGMIASSFYVLLFAVHFMLLPHSGQGDAFMTDEFKMSLVGTRHRWESKWYQWIMNQRGLLYFNELDDEVTNFQKIYLIVNPAVSVMSLVAILGFVFILFCVYFPRKWSGHLHPRSRLPAFAVRGLFLLMGYVVNILPYVEVARCTFLYHYLPPLFYALLSTANLIDLIPKVGAQRMVSGFFFVILFVTFLIWSPWIYASPLTPAAHKWRRLFGDNWA